MKKTCIRGHDTSFPEARNSRYMCKECQKINDRAYAISAKGKQRDKRYATGNRGRITILKRELRYSIADKTQRISELEAQLERMTNV